jgi:predicted AlkP superfamily phosphohydrolase/phosphomutase
VRYSKVFAIGVDGGTLELVRPWAQAGKLPTFARMMAQGAVGELESTIPPITGPAWASFMTGKNPGGHGVGDWMRRVDGGYRLTPVNATEIKSRLFWDLLGQAGKRVGIINVPVTYPPRPLNGFLISGLLTPRGSQDFTYPPALAQELQQELGSYQAHLKVN